MAKVSLKSRLPEIAAELRPRVGAAVKASAEVVAEDAQSRVVIGPPTEHIYDNIKTVRREAAGYEVQVDATDPKGVEYPWVVEFGGKTQAPHPFLIPALEANKENAIALVTGAVRGVALYG